jgi:hypothetical protein
MLQQVVSYFNMCHTCFSKENQVQAYMQPGSSFMHIVTYKWIRKTVSRKKKGDYWVYAKSWEWRLQTSQAVD